MDEGYIKFNAKWAKTPPLPKANIQNINHWRNVMYQHQLIGAYPNGIGYGNISERIGNTNQFIISGSKTGNYPTIDERHYALVSQVLVDLNTLECEGSILASSESMSHAAIYQTLDWVQGVIHIHHFELWKKLLHQAPTTDKSAPYGSPEMVYSILDLLENTNLAQQKIFVMEGHEEGIFVFDTDLEAATRHILKYFS